MASNKKILCLFDYKSFTGFSSVSSNIKSEIKKHFGNELQLDICAINYFGEPIEEEDGSYVVSAIKSASKKDDFGRFGFLKILNDSNEYDGIFVLQDLGVIVPIIPILKGIKEEKKRNNKKSFKSIFYFPVDCKLIDKLVDGLEFFDLLVAYTDYGKNEVLKINPKLKTKVKVVPHGNNSKHFYPITKDEIQSFRDEYFGENSNKFIITNINRNQPRKDIPQTIFAFIEAKNRWKENGLLSEPFLYLHMNSKDPMGWDIRALILQTDLIENVDYKLLDMDIANVGASIEMVNNIYNASDLYITTTLGEGWGLTLTEAMATKTPIICPLSTSFIEMTDNGKRAYGIDYLKPFSNTSDNVIRLQCDLEELSNTILYVAQGMQGLSEDATFMEQHNIKIDKAYKYVQSLDWKQVCKTWIQYFKEIF
jgi:glycosyltransferase involved in cell wall biosynthesis